MLQNKKKCIFLFLWPINDGWLAIDLLFFFFSFFFHYSISNNQLQSLSKHYRENGVCPPRKRSGGRKYNTHALSHDDVTQAVKYITDFAEDQAMVIPGRVAGVSCSDPRVRLLPSAQSKYRVWRKYSKDMEALNELRQQQGELNLRKKNVLKRPFSC